MNLSVGIVGLPNVGKSTLFNALLKKQQAFVANYPFATIEPNIGVVPVPDERLEVLAKITAEEILKSIRQAQDPEFTEGQVQAFGSEAQARRDDKSKWPPIVPATVKFVDIAGLVKGAAEGAGLGNKFLSHIREVSIIAHVVRAFEDENIIKEGAVDPKSDYETIQTELTLADIQTLEKSKILNVKKASILSSIESKRREAVQKIHNDLNHGIPVREMKLSDEDADAIRDLFLLTAKPEIVVLNVSEEDYNASSIESISQKYKEMLKQVQHDNGDNIVVICAKIEAELAELSEDEQKQYLEGLAFKESGLERLIKKAYETLGLISFFTTTGEKEVRAWTLRAGSSALRASGEIHTDFMQKFIKAEVVSYDDFVKLSGWRGAREKGKARMEGRDYVIQDGEVVEFKIGN